ncbi:hypothetical protein QZH41_012720 [Actinostola sp. cb2023]|nr:hypothetical protein QZH41_012720 [Actinostola sp. cb2023]
MPQKLRKPILFGVYLLNPKRYRLGVLVFLLNLRPPKRYEIADFKSSKIIIVLKPLFSFSKSLIRACITLLPILGLTWFFGILAINKKTIVFEYLFCIFNSIQGVLIFLFYCVGSSEVRRECKRQLHNYETQRNLRSSSSAFKSSSKHNNSSTCKPPKSTELISIRDKDGNDDTRL